MAGSYFCGQGSFVVIVLTYIAILLLAWILQANNKLLEFCLCLNNKGEKAFLKASTHHLFVLKYVLSYSS